MNRTMIPQTRTFLEFERPIGELMAKVDELRLLSTTTPEISLLDEISQLEHKVRSLTEDIFGKLTPWQKTQLSRHPDRPYSGDYLEHTFHNFVELHGDRYASDDKAMIAGLAQLEDIQVMVISQEKGRGTKDRVYRNFGMPRPEGYRKALRLMKMAEKFRIPIVCLIDTPGAYPGKEAEERGQAEAIARNLMEMIKLTVPVLCVVIGEGGSGGALAIGLGNKVLMMQYAIYSVISPEGCASILWKDSARADLAAEALRLTAEEVLAMKVVDGVIPEPVGGAHRNPVMAADLLREYLAGHLRDLMKLSPEELTTQRFNKFMAMGVVLEE